MHQSGNDQCQPTILLGGGQVAHALVLLGRTIKRAHEYAEAGVTGNRRHGADHRHVQPVGGDVADILPKSEAQRHKSRIHHAVKGEIEGGGHPGTLFQQIILGAFFCRRHDHEIFDQLINKRIFRPNAAQQPEADFLCHQGDCRSQNAAENQRSQKLRRLLFPAVGPVNFDQ